MFMLPVTTEMKEYLCVTGGARAVGPTFNPGSHRWLLPEQPRMGKGPKTFAIFLIAFILLI